MRTLEAIPRSFAAVFGVAPRSVDIVIADDDPDILEYLAAFIADAGYTCAQAENGREAVEIAQQLAPRLFLLDLMMPEVDGFEVARRIRLRPRTADTPVLGLTARGDTAAYWDALNAGFDLLLTKPVDPAELLDVIRITLACRGRTTWHRHRLPSERRKSDAGGLDRSAERN